MDDTQILLFALILSILQENITRSIIMYKESLKYKNEYYSYNYYQDAIYELERFLKTYPDHPSTDYAYYLLGISYYDQIVDETKDLGAITKSKKYFEYVINNFPNM